MEIQLVHLVTATLILIAFGMGLGLEADNFRKIIVAPKGIVLGSMGQLILLPLIALVLAFFAVSPAVAVGILLIGVCPGGSSSNYLSYLAKGDVALSVSLTVISGMLSVVTVPVFFNIATGLVLGSSISVTLPVLDSMMRIFLYLVTPVILGMVIRHYLIGFAEKWKGWVASLAFVALLIETPFLISEHLQNLSGSIGGMIILVALLILITMGSGFFIGRIFGLPITQTRSLTVEIGVQNIALAIVLALTYFDEPEYVVAPVLYLFLMYVFVPAFIVLCRMAEKRKLLRVAIS